MKQKLLEMVQVNIPNFFIFKKFKNEEGMAKKLAFFFTLFLKLVDKGFLAKPALFFRVQHNKKKMGTVTWTISNIFCFILFPYDDEFHFFGLSADAAYFKSLFPG